MNITFDKAVDRAISERERSLANAQYKTDPVKWANDTLGAFLWSKQKEIAYSVANNPRTAVRSCNNAGKTKIAGIIGSWFIAVNDPHDTIVVCTAPAFAQIKTNLFHEFGTNIRVAKERGNPLPGYITVGQNIAEWKYEDGSQLALGRRPPDKDAVTSFMGIHRANVLVIIDEAGGTPPELFTLAERITTTGNAKILAIGNPDRRSSDFHRMFSEDSDWNQIHISGYDTPNFTNEPFPDELRKYMLQPAWVERQRRVWGENDPRFQVSVLGEFPDSDDSVFFPQSIIDKSYDTTIEDDLEVPLILGVDLARFGDDSSVVYTNRGGRIRKYAKWSKATAVESANRVHTIARELDARYVNIDAGGLGGPVIDILMTMGGPYSIVAMDGGSASPDPRRWLNARAWWYDSLREKMTLRQIDLDIEDEDLRSQMSDINMEFTPRGSIKVESKKDLKARTGGSPDDLDAVVYASYNPDENILAPSKQILYQDPSDIIGEMPSYLTLMTDWA